MKQIKLSSILFILSGLSVLFMSCYKEAKASEQATLSDTTLQWQKIEDLSSISNPDNKNIIIDVYTDWCKWCKVMDDKTFSDPDLMSYLNDNYLLVKFNAENKSPLQFKGKNFNYVKTGRRGYNQLAAELCKDKLSYPSFVVLDSEFNTVQVIRGFKDAIAFRQILNVKNS